MCGSFERVRDNATDELCEKADNYCFFINSSIFLFLHFALHITLHRNIEKHRVSRRNRLHFPKERHKNAIKYTDSGVASNHGNGNVTAGGRPP